VDPITLTLKNNRFEPNAVTAPEGERLRIHVKNEDSTPAEFESHDLRVEKIVTPGGRISVSVGPLKPGTYKFFDEYHPDTAQGTLTVDKKGQ
jgi:heme/copper-type cytochrome/quinol oxidase subunit 2